MNIRSFSFLLVSLILAGPALRAQDAPMGGPGPAQKKEEDKTDLEKTMDKINKAARVLKKQIADPAQNASSLDLVKKIQAAAGDASKMTPAKADDVPAAERAQFLEDYRAGMKEFLAATDDLEAALKAGDNPQAQALFKKLGQLEGKNHKKFKRPDKDKA